MNIKRFLSGALCAVLLLALCPAAAADAPCEISSAEELSLLRETPDGDFVLTADIDMTGVDWQPIAFSGTLDGGGHTIYNLTVTSLGADRAETVDGNDKTYDTALTGFFSVLSGASVRDLSLRGVNIAVETPENVFAGTLAGFASPETVLENVSVFDARIDLTETCQRKPIDEHDRCIAGIGGLVGFGGGTYTNCSADSTLVFSDESIASLRCEEFLGGILSCGNAALTGCTAAIDGYAACRGYAHNGGLVGMFYQYDKTVDIGTVSGCAVTGRITFFEDNADRRAYCEAFAGEFLTWTNITECTADFQRNEIFDYSAAVKPENALNRPIPTRWSPGTAIPSAIPSTPAPCAAIPTATHSRRRSTPPASGRKRKRPPRPKTARRRSAARSAARKWKNAPCRSTFPAIG